MGKHDKTGEAMDDFYRARIAKLERENSSLREQLEKRAVWYGAGKEAYDEKLTELHKENEKLADENWKLRNALIREAIRDVEV